MIRLNGKQKLSAVIGVCIVAAYAVYMYAHPEADGALFAFVVGTLGLLAGIKLGEAITSDSVER